MYIVSPRKHESFWSIMLYYPMMLLDFLAHAPPPLGWQPTCCLVHYPTLLLLNPKSLLNPILQLFSRCLFVFLLSFSGFVPLKFPLLLEIPHHLTSFYLCSLCSISIYIYIGFKQIEQQQN